MTMNVAIMMPDEVMGFLGVGINGRMDTCI